MKKVCFFCEKSNAFGGKRKHKYGGGWEFRAKHMNRKFKANLREIKLEKDGVVSTVTVCMKCYKKLKKEE